MWYNSQAVREADGKRSLKIEQQERSTKHNANSAKYESRRLRVIYTQQVKEAKN